MCAVAHEQADDDADVVLLDSYVKSWRESGSAVIWWLLSPKSIIATSFGVGDTELICKQTIPFPRKIALGTQKFWEYKTG